MSDEAKKVVEELIDRYYKEKAVKALLETFSACSDIDRAKKTSKTVNIFQQRIAMILSKYKK
jgi:hypothetical protein